MEVNTGLIHDCESLLELKDALVGDSEINWSVSIPIVRWQGIDLGGSPPRVVRLNLGFQKLTGTVPSGLGRLDGLQYLFLADNRLTGEIPPELGELQNLRYLNLAVNRLEGYIPPELGSLSNLEFLDLAQNQLTGSIPPEIGKLSRLTDLVLDSNRLSGDLPDALTELNDLNVFVIDRNYFTGCVPEVFKVERHSVGDLRYCGDPPIAWPPQPVFSGGVDLVARYVERQPRYPVYTVSYLANQFWCPYPFDEPKGPVLCQNDPSIKRNPAPGDTVQLIAHVSNFGDTDSEHFDYVWRLDGEVIESGIHEAITAGSSTEITLDIAWPDEASNPVVTFEIDPNDGIGEVLENNNEIHDWIKGHTIGIYFSEEAYESLKRDFEPVDAFQSPEHWLHNNFDQLNEMLTRAGVEDRVRAELFFVAPERTLEFKHELRWLMDGWWGFWHENPYHHGDDWSYFNLERLAERPEIDLVLLHVILHQLGSIDIYRMVLWDGQVQLRDANRLDKFAGCGLDYWNSERECFRFSPDIRGIMAELVPYIGIHAAGGLDTNYGHRRGFYGEYLFDTPDNNSVKIVDKNGDALEKVELRFYQLEEQQVGDEFFSIVDDVVEFTVTTDESGNAPLPDRGITGIVTATGHQLRPNPFGIISVVGNNGIFIIEMTSEECTNYEWLTIIELNLAYWDGQTEHAEFTKTLRCPPP